MIMKKPFTAFKNKIRKCRLKYFRDLPILEIMSKLLIPSATIIVAVVSFVFQVNTREHNRQEEINNKPMTIEYAFDESQPYNLQINYDDKSYSLVVPLAKAKITGGTVVKFYAFTYDFENHRYSNFLDVTHQILMDNSYEITYDSVVTDGSNFLKVEKDIYFITFLLFEDTNSNNKLDMVFMQYNTETERLTQGYLSKLSLLNPDENDLMQLYRKVCIDYKNLCDIIGPF